MTGFLPQLPWWWRELQLVLRQNPVWALVGAVAVALLHVLFHFKGWWEVGVESPMARTEFVAPLLSAVAVAHGPLLEWVGQFLDLRLTLDRSFGLSIALRFLALALVVAGVVAAIGGVYALALGWSGIDWSGVMGAGLPGCFFLSGVALFAGVVAKQEWIGAGFAAAWWMVDVVTRGQFTHSLYLFGKTLPGLDPEAASKPALLLTGLVLWLVAGALTARRRRWMEETAW